MSQLKTRLEVLGDASKEATKILRCALYVRGGVDDGREAADNRLAALRLYAEQQGWRVNREYVDHEDIRISDRKELKRMFADAELNRFDFVFFSGLEQLTRGGALETLRFLNMLCQYGVGFYSLAEPHLDSFGPSKDTVIAVIAVLAKQERIRVSDRIKAALARAKNEGTRTGRPIGRPRAAFCAAQALALRQRGHSWREITCKLGVGITTARRACTSASQTQEAVTQRRASANPRVLG
jgi:DNA invertase Pin-like site-specific DNA recombinase